MVKCVTHTYISNYNANVSSNSTQPQPYSKGPGDKAIYNSMHQAVQGSGGLAFVLSLQLGLNGTVAQGIMLSIV